MQSDLVVVRKDTAGDIASTSADFVSHTANGAAFRIRPLRASDREREVAFIDSLSERSRYLRLLTPQKVVSAQLVDQLMTIDGVRSMAFVATAGAGDEGSIIGIARYGATEAPDTAELGITVADDWQRQGIATQLIRVLSDYARAHGISRLTGIVLWQNSRMLALANSLGFQTHHEKDGLAHIELRLDRTD
jgi:acetyltransferase